MEGGFPLGGEYAINGIPSGDFNPNDGVGSYQLNYLFTDQNACSSSDSVSFEVHPLPEPSFVAADVCFGNTALLENTSSIPSGSITSSQWDFGNASSSDLFNPPGINYLTPGEFNITLNLTSNEGCSAALTQSIQILASPEVNFSLEDACLDELFNFTNTTNVQGGFAENWEWTIDGEPVSLNENLSNYQFGASGIHDIALTVGSNEGCSNTLEQSVNVFDLPQIDLVLDDACAGVPVSMFSNASVSDGTIENYEWSIDGILTSTTENYLGTFNNPGDVDITLNVLSNHGCDASTSDTFTVFAAPIIDFTQSESIGCNLSTVEFEDLSTAAGSTVVSWEWTVNGTFISGMNTASFNPQDPGMYDLSLTVGTPEGCFSDTLIQNAIELFPSPTATYTLSSENITMLFPEVSITNTSEGSVDQIFTLPNGQSFDSESIDYSFLEPGNYAFELWVENEYGCVDSTQIVIPVEQVILIHVPNAFTPDGDGVNEVFVPVLNDIDVSDYRFEIYNRWGEVIFASETPGEGWNGNVKGGEHFAEDGVYTYRLVLRETQLFEERELSGHVTLIR